MQQPLGRRVQYLFELTACIILFALCTNTYFYLQNMHSYTKLLTVYSNQNRPSAMENLILKMIDTRFGYMNAYYDNRSDAVVVFGKVFFSSPNETELLIKNAICDFYSENETFLYSVNLHYFTTYMFYCNISENATIPSAVSLRLAEFDQRNQPVEILMPPINENHGKM